jgi:hypothetical protein
MGLTVPLARRRSGVRREPPLELFGKVRCTGCGTVLRVVRSRGLKTRRELRVQLACDTCRARYRLRWEAL